MSADQEHGEAPASPEIHFEPVVTLPKVDTKTFEENEEEMVKLRAKLFRYIVGQHDTTPEWKERGVGDVKILKNTVKQSYRLVMRREKTLKVCANHFLTTDMELKPNCGSDRAWVWNVSADYADEEPRKETLAIRFANAEKNKEIPRIKRSGFSLQGETRLPKNDASKFKQIFDKCKESLASPTNVTESEKLASELESLKVNDDSEKQNGQDDTQNESSGEGTSIETKAEELQGKGEDTKKDSDTDTTVDNPPETSDSQPETSDSQPAPSENPPETSDNPPETSDNQPETSDNQPETPDNPSEN